MTVELEVSPPKRSDHTNALLEALAGAERANEKPHATWLRNGMSILQVTALVLGVLLLFGLIWGVARDIGTFVPH